MKTGKFVLLVMFTFGLCISGAFAGGSDESTTTAAGFNATGYPVVDEQIQLTFAIDPTPQKDDMDDLEFFWPIEEKTNIDIVWQVLPHSSP